MRGHTDIAKVVAEQNPKKIEIGETVIGSIGYGRYGGRQIIGKFKGRRPTGELVITDRGGRDVYVVSIRRVKMGQQIKRSPAIEKDIEKLKQSPYINKIQLKRLLEITQGDIAGLKVGYRQETKNIWIVYRGRRYDIDKRGNISRQEKLGRPNLTVANALARKLTCPLCGAENQVPKHEIEIKCDRCGFPLRRVRIKIR